VGISLTIAKLTCHPVGVLYIKGSNDGADPGLLIYHFFDNALLNLISIHSVPPVCTLRMYMPTGHDI
jgi:hypothetical protein